MPQARFFLLSAVAMANALLGALFFPAQAQSAAPMVMTQAPGYYRMMLGDFQVTAINDGTILLDAEALLAEPQKDTLAALQAKYEPNPVETSDNAFLVNTGAKLVLIDTGGGDLLGPSLGHLLANLRAAGYAPEQVDDIFITHMHPDHVGGLATHGARAFSNAIVHADSHDANYWLSREHRNQAPGAKQPYFDGAMASLKPYVDAGRFKSFDSDEEVVAGVRSVATHGHTPGHSAYLVESRGQKLLLIGDLIHVAAVQFDRPEVTIAFDSDPAAAAATRKTVFARIGADGALVGAPHLQFPGLGHLQSHNSSWRWIPVNYTTQLGPAP